MKELNPDLSSVSFSAFGLGDSTYETFCNGIDVMASLMKELGATQAGETGRHDAAKGVSLTDACTEWAKLTLA